MTHTEARPPQKRDVSIMGTNDSSIVSKSSVAKLYFPDEPDFYGAFIRKPQRRSPLINRGYWLRMEAIERTVLDFLEEHAHQETLVVNLGCGYDPLPFQIWHRHPELCERTTFVDVDYPALIEKKKESILRTPLLRESLKQPVEENPKSPVFLQAGGYKAIGCDLRQLALLEAALKEQCDIQNRPVIFVAEVSVTYMTLKYADKLIKWSSSFPSARFCLLEQFFPDGPTNPFARTMMAHFDGLGTHLQGISKYPRLQDQYVRFKLAGWSSVRVRNMWELWGDDEFIPVEKRKALDQVEPFDEWEEFALFSGHYFLLVADTSKSNCANVDPRPEQLEKEGNIPLVTNRHLEIKPIVTSDGTAIEVPPDGRRRHGAAFLLRKDVAACHGGVSMYGSRTNSIDVFCKKGATPKLEGPQDAEPRMCHTITHLGDDECLMVGGRAAPNRAIETCYHLKAGVWNRVDGLAEPRYRHCAVHVKITHEGDTIPAVLVFGGKSSSGEIFNDWWLWDSAHGWREVKADGSKPAPRFGHAMSNISSASTQGLVTGGIGVDGKVLSDMWRWTLQHEDGLRISCEEISHDIDDGPESAVAKKSLPRFGASMVTTKWGVFLIGGVGDDRVLNAEEEILLIRDPSPLKLERLLYVSPLPPRMMLIGFGAVALDDSEVLLMGGGAICFSFGSFINSVYFSIREYEQTSSAGPINGTIADRTRPHVAKAKQILDQSWRTSHDQLPTLSQPSEEQGPPITKVRSVRVESPEDFEQIVAAGQPVIITGADIGPCSHLWSTDYLCEKIGGDREVVVHASTSERMTFAHKNFTYVKRRFSAFLHAITAAGEPSYLRAVSTDKPLKHPTSLAHDFPTIAPDFRLPLALAAVIAPTMHSSPLRIAGPVRLWLHYDVLANILCQVRGRKRLRLFPPADVSRLAYAPGASSSDVDVEAGGWALRGTHPHDAVLNPTDILYIPPLWSHTAQPLGGDGSSGDDGGDGSSSSSSSSSSSRSKGVSVAVNVFFRNLPDRAYAAGKDVYGNRDLAAYELGRREVERIVKGFGGLPADVARFYLERLVGELRGKVDELGGAEGGGEEREG